MIRAIQLVVVVVAACGGAPSKPPELANLESMRRSRDAEAAAAQEPQLVKEADQFQKRSTGAWKTGSLEDSRRDALAATIKLKHAISLWEQADAQRRIKAADDEKARADKDFARVNKELTAVTEQIALLEKLATAKSAAEKDKLRAEQEKARLAAELAAQQQKGEAQNRIAAAELALKTADTVDARTYAKAEYQAALDLIARANSEVQAGSVAAAITSADQAKQKAEQATSIAKPEYDKTTASKDRKARDEALGREAAALAGVTVRIETKGEVTRLVLTYSGAFKGKSTNITPGKESVLDGVAALLKKYPTYPMQIIGHTDSTGRADSNLVVSNARAQAVFNALAQRGVDAKRFAVSGVGSSQPISDNRTPAGRAKNNRVELVFMYQ
jgi:outer membrane protein OmpA-like peptidoglycan-associated protein